MSVVQLASDTAGGVPDAITALVIALAVLALLLTSDDDRRFR